MQRVAVTIEGDAEIEPAVAHGLLQERKVRRAAPDVDVVAIRRVPDRRHVRAEAFECRRRYAGVRAVRAIDRDAQAGEVGAKPLDHVLEVALCREADAIDLAAAR